MGRIYSKRSRPALTPSAKTSPPPSSTASTRRARRSAAPRARSAPTTSPTSSCRPAGYTHTGDTVGTPFGGTDQPPGTIVNIQVDGCHLGTGYNFGETKNQPTTNSISGYVYEDCNVNGVRDAGEPGIAGVLIGFA